MRKAVVDRQLIHNAAALPDLESVMVNTIYGGRGIVAAAIISGSFFGSRAIAAETPAQSPYGTLARDVFKAAPPADMVALARDLARRGTVAGLRKPPASPAPTDSIAPDLSSAEGKAGALADVIFAAPVLPADRNAEFLVKETSPGMVDAVVFAAPSRLPAAVSGGVGAETFVNDQSSGLADDVVFAAPSSVPAMASVEASESKPTAPAVAPISAPASGAGDAKPDAVAASTSDASLPTPSEVAEYLRQAREELRKGRIAASRALLEKAVAGGDAEAHYLLARTFDPVALAHDGAVGIAADAAKAAELYRLAQAGGYSLPDGEARAARP